MSRSFSEPYDEFTTEAQPTAQYEWHQQPTASLEPGPSPRQIRHQPYVPQTPFPPPPARLSPKQLERQRIRRSATIRLAIILAMAVPLTGIASTDVFTQNPFTRLAAILITWLGIAAVSWIITGCPTPRHHHDDD